MAGLTQDETPLATPHPELSSEQRPAVGLTINLTGTTGYAAGASYLCGGAGREAAADLSLTMGGW